MVCYLLIVIYYGVSSGRIFIGKILFIVMAKTILVTGGVGCIGSVAVKNCREMLLEDYRVYLKKFEGEKL